MSILWYCILYDLYGNSRINQTVREKRGLSFFFVAERDQPSFQKCWECQDVGWNGCIRNVWALLFKPCSFTWYAWIYYFAKNVASTVSTFLTSETPSYRSSFSKRPPFRLERRSANDVARRKAKDWGVNTWCQILFWNTCEELLIQTSVPGTSCFSLLWLFVKGCNTNFLFSSRIRIRKKWVQYSCLSVLAVFFPVILGLQIFQPFCYASLRCLCKTPGFGSQPSWALSRSRFFLRWKWWRFKYVDGKVQWESKIE